MKKLSKTAILALSIALVLGLVACPNKTEPKPEPEPTPGPGPVVPTPTPTGIPTASTADSNGFVTISAGSMPLSSDGSYHVTITKPFKICDHEVTQAEWQNVMGNNPSYFQGEEEGKKVAEDEVQANRPVEQVTWYQAIAYCNERTKKENIKIGTTETIDYVYFSDEALTTAYTTTDASNGNVPHMKIDAKGYRLPTEAEWEIAARGGVVGDCYAGTVNQSELGTYAWYSANSDSKTHEVKKKSPNAYGLYDMSGNVLEWCWDWYDSSAYTGEATDPTGSPAGSYRVGRGGNWSSVASGCRASNRGWGNPSRGWDDNGLRVVRSASSL